MIFNKEIGEWVMGPGHFEEMRRCCVAELGDLRWMKRSRAGELGGATMSISVPLQRVFYAEFVELRRLQRFRAAEHEAAALGDLKRIWKPRFRAPEPGTAQFEHCARDCAFFAPPPVGGSGARM